MFPFALHFFLVDQSEIPISKIGEKPTPVFSRKAYYVEKLGAHHIWSFPKPLKLQVEQGETPESGHYVHAQSRLELLYVVP